MIKLIKNKFSNEFFIKLIESFLGRGSFLIFTLLFSFICARLYGAEIFGEYTYVYTLVSILMVLAKAGLDNGLIYSIPKDQYKNISFSFLLNFLLSFLLIFIVWFFIDDVYIKFMLPLIWLISAEQLFFGIYRSEGKIKEYYFTNGFLSMLLRIILIISLYYLSGKNEYSIAIGVYISFIFSNLVYFIHHKNKFRKVIFDKNFLYYSFPLILTSVMGTMINKVDIIMLGNMTNNVSVGIYQITVQVSNLASVLLLVFTTVFAPKIANLYHTGKLKQLKKMYIKATRILAIISMITTLILIIGSETILFAFGKEFIDGESALIIRSVGQFVKIAVGAVWLMLSMTGEPKFQMYANVIALIINVLLNFIFIPKYGIDGAAFASMVSIIFINVLGYAIVSQRFGIKVFKYF